MARIYLPSSAPPPVVEPARPEQPDTQPAAAEQDTPEPAAKESEGGDEDDDESETASQAPPSPPPRALTLEEPATPGGEPARCAHVTRSGRVCGQPLPCRYHTTED